LIVAHDKHRALIAERGRQDWESELARMPRLFRDPSSIPGLTWPTVTFSDRLTIQLGGDRGALILAYCGRGHTEGDIVAWLPDQKILFAGDLVEAQAALYTGDAFHQEWATGTLDNIAALGAESLVGGRGAVAHGSQAVTAAVGQTRDFLDSMLARVGAVQEAGGTPGEASPPRTRPRSAVRALADLRAPHALSMSRGCGRARGYRKALIWTAERDRQVWDQLQD
jgi:glyoxylase-like metal-dependent hydrolase (beta-lactamase superfamily II)